MRPARSRTTLATIDPAAAVHRLATVTSRSCQAPPAAVRTAVLRALATDIQIKAMRVHIQHVDPLWTWNASGTPPHDPGDYRPCCCSAQASHSDLAELPGAPCGCANGRAACPCQHVRESLSATPSPS